MQVKYIGGEDSVALTYGKTYSVISIEFGLYRILTELEEDYLFPPEAFEILLNTPPLLSDVQYICLDGESSGYERLTGGACIFFCAEHPNNAGKKIAGILLSNGCREFHFTGQWAGEWENACDGVVVSEQIEDDSDTVVTTMTYDFSPDYVCELASTLFDNSLERKLFVFYYNACAEECYESMGQIFQYLIDNTLDQDA